MNRRSFLQSLGLVASTAAASSGATYGLTHRRIPPQGVYVQMGTSITAGIHAPGAYLTPVVVGSRLNLTPINVGFDGACAGIYNRPYLDELSLCRLTDSILSGDWSPQDKSTPFLSPDILPALSRIKAIDFNKVSHIGLEYGTNDFTVAAPIGTDGDPDVRTFKGSLTHAIRKLLASFPRMHLFLITPAWRLNFQNLDCDSHPNEGGIFLKQYVEAMLEVAALNHIPCLDMWRTLGINADNFKSFTADGLHPNEAGARRRGEVIASFMNSVF
jgi:lysophospholipase L1-like esterase